MASSSAPLRLYSVTLSKAKVNIRDVYSTVILFPSYCVCFFQQWRVVALDNRCATDLINVNSFRIFTRRHVTYSGQYVSFLFA